MASFEQTLFYRDQISHFLLTESHFHGGITHSKILTCRRVSFINASTNSHCAISTKCQGISFLDQIYNAILCVIFIINSLVYLHMPKFIHIY